MPLIFSNPMHTYDGIHTTFRFVGEDGETTVPCAITQEAVDDYLGGNFEGNRSTIEQMASDKYDAEGVGDDKLVRITTKDF